MKKGIVFLITIILVFSLVIIGISKTNNQSQSEEKIKIIATLFPQYDFAKQIGGDKVEVSLLLTPGTETHTYEPTPQDIINVNKADLYIYTGKYMEPWSDKIANSITSDTKVLDASKNINLIKMYINFQTFFQKGFLSGKLVQVHEIFWREILHCKIMQ